MAVQIAYLQIYAHTFTKPECSTSISLSRQQENRFRPAEIRLTPSFLHSHSNCQLHKINSPCTAKLSASKNNCFTRETTQPPNTKPGLCSSTQQERSIDRWRATRRNSRRQRPHTTQLVNIQRKISEVPVTHRAVLLVFTQVTFVYQYIIYSGLSDLKVGNKIIRMVVTIWVGSCTPPLRRRDESLYPRKVREHVYLRYVRMMVDNNLHIVRL